MDDELVHEVSGGIRAVATHDGYIAIEALIEGVMLSFDCTQESALKLAAQILEASDQLQEKRGVK